MEVERIDDYILEIKQSNGMNVPVKIVANKSIEKNLFNDKTLQQAVNASKLPGIVGSMWVMPDAHEGYGFPVGGVGAFDAEEGIISPGAVGFDINCGVRVIKTDLTYNDIKDKLNELGKELFRRVPSGVGSKLNIGLTKKDLDYIATEGVDYIIGKGFGLEEDKRFIEENGHIEGADVRYVSEMASKRGLKELGTIGAGNHFLEVQRVERIDDEDLAKRFGLFKDQIVIMLHTGSRGYGHQICSDYLIKLNDYQKRNKIKLEDPQLSYAHVNSKEAEEYLAAMRAAVNYAFTNREIITDIVRDVFAKVLSINKDNLEMPVLYDVAHNIVKLEEHIVENKRMKLFVHRKGATRAFGPNAKGVPDAYKDVGQPVLIPGSMGTASYILAGREKAMHLTFGSSCHGAGRVMSRHKALREIPASKTLEIMKSKGIILEVRDKRLVSEEAEFAYKNVDDVVESVSGAGISKIVSRDIPLVVVKG
ncbi:MAG: RNA-splicing ligase RtcB [Candidatus Micrarchaeota archaeon]|nr:MAG: RNA-splicing ligase RtcB [Candidatus Micrarchaeota archaeon]